jgi:UDP-N-acetylglucosamine 4,6-dehydratase
MDNFKDKVILITGGTGTFGTNFINYLVNNEKKIKKIIIFSRDELKQFNLSKKYENSKISSKLRFFLGDIRDRDRVYRALKEVDIVVHAAALKQVPAAEYNPIESIKTNVLGTQNLIEASIDLNVKKFISLSTDKAAAPVNLYGATKLCSDKLTISANNIKGKRDIAFSVVRYGNVMFSRGSVIPEFIKQQNSGTILITHKEMTRFNISIENAIDKVIWLINHGIGGEILIPKLKSIKIMDLAKAINEKTKIKIIGLRPGEKIHEELITKSDSFNTYECKDHFMILNNEKKLIKNYIKRKYKKVSDFFFYDSGANKTFLSKNEIRKILKEKKLISSVGQS